MQYLPAAPALGVELIFSFFLDLLPMLPIYRRAREWQANLKLMEGDLVSEKDGKEKVRDESYAHVICV